MLLSSWEYRSPTTCPWRIDTVEEKRSDPRSAQRPRTQTPDGLVGSFPKVDRITQRSRAVSGELLYGGQFCRQSRCESELRLSSGTHEVAVNSELIGAAECLRRNTE